MSDMDAYHIQLLNDGSKYTDVPGLNKETEAEVYVYLADEVDARIAELEKALRQTDCKCRQASETPYFYVPVVSYKCPRCAALSL